MTYLSPEFEMRPLAMLSVALACSLQHMSLAWDLSDPTTWNRVASF